MENRYTTDDYHYLLNEAKIAKYPLKERDASKLLVYQQGRISDDIFKNISKYIPQDTFLFFNDTKVIEARLHFFKDSGAKIEIFLLNPVLPSSDIAISMLAKEKCTWKCTIGNKKKWKSGQMLKQQVQVADKTIDLNAELLDSQNDIVLFNWNSGHSFSDILHCAGKIPIPPYLQRDKEDIDDVRYQTVYSHHKGAVAAPTAGLHFTDDVISKLREKGVSMDFATLHVSAGTFKPVQVDDYRQHDMHTEQIIVSLETLKILSKRSNVMCVGTTSLRIIESLYWMGVKLFLKQDNPFFISRDFPYSINDSSLPTCDKLLNAIIYYLEEKGIDYLHGETQIFIYPGYNFQICKGLITNFHLPKSTLLLLVSALIGAKWKEVYEHALQNNYRFLSYGDSSLLIP